MSRRLRQFGILAALAGCVLTPDALAEPSEFPPSKMYATAWGLTLAGDGTGFYNDLATFILEGLSIDYEIRPYRRAMRHFFETQDSCLYPKSVASLLRTKEVPTNAGFIDSIPIQKTFVAVFTMPGRPVIENATDLKGKRVAYAMGSKVPEYLGPDGVFFIAVADEVNKAEMLLSGRVDVLVANLPDVGMVYQHLKAPMPNYDPSFQPFAAARSRFLCHDTPGNQAFMDQLNHRIKSLRISGALANFYRGNGLDPDLYLKLED
ncbi:MAG: hypothetical protein HWE25_08740 [Alphaproteobacteria bacterium]|nr:hypothetical protein [Alphaproteobacteria bacterium]